MQVSISRNHALGRGEGLDCPGVDVRHAEVILNVQLCWVKLPSCCSESEMKLWMRVSRNLDVEIYWRIGAPKLSILSKMFNASCMIP